MSKKLILGAVVVAGLVFLFSRSKTESSTVPAVVSTSPDATPSESSDASSTPSSQTFDGDPCSSDCSGHEAGYNWAEENGIEDEDDCDTAGDNSNSPSFAEGCRDYVEENGSSDDNKDDSNN